MRKLLFFIFIFFASISVAQAQDMNLSFENWKQVTPPLGSTYEDIDGWWATVNDVRRITGDNNHLTAFKYSPAQHGNYGIRLRSVQALTTFIPGVVVTGTFSFQQQQLNQGKPFTGKPIQLKGYYRYSPVSNDSGVAYIHLSKWNSTLNRRDTLARDSMLFIGNQSEWKLFELNLDYSQYPGVTPDSIVIRFVSSVNAGFGGGKVGSELMIDNLSIEYPVSKIPISKENFSFYPNPFHEKATLKFSQNANFFLEIYNSTGNLVFHNEILTAQQDFDFHHFISGIYYLVIKNENHQILGTQKIIKE